MSDSATRARMVEQAIKVDGVTRDEAEMLVDLSAHAFDKAFATARTVIDTGPPHLRLPILASVFASFTCLFRETLPEHFAAVLASTEGAREDGVIILPARTPEARK